MINASVNPASASRNPALIKAQIDSADAGSSLGKLFGRHSSSLSTISESGNHHGIPRLHATISKKSNKMYSKKVIGKSLQKRKKRTLSSVNQLAAGCSAMVGSAWIRGVSLYNPANLAMSLMQQVPALVATVCPDCPGLISTARSAADWGQAYGWANSIYTAMATGNVAAVAATAALCGASYASHHISRDTVSQLCTQLPASVREYGEPWLQAATGVALAGALKVAETVGTGGAKRGSGDRFIVPEHEATHPATKATLPSVVFDNLWDNHSEPHYATGMAMGINATEPPQVRCSENSLPGFAISPDRPAFYAPAEVSQQTAVLARTRTVILPANHTGQGRPMPTDAVPFCNPKGRGVVVGFLQLPLAEAGLIRSFTREQQKAHLQQAARQHQALPKQCPDLAGAVSGSDNGTVYPSESHTSGWVASPGNRIFHYQLFSADPGSPLVTDTEGKQIPAPGFLRLAQKILNGIQENAETVNTLPLNVVANQLPIASAHLSPPKIQNRLDPEVLATEVNNSTMLVLKPCNALTRQPEASVLVLSADRQARSVSINIGTEGFQENRSLRARRQVQPDELIRLAPDCRTENSGFIRGRLEVFVNGEWGTVCDDLFDPRDARVACTQLGYSGAMAHLIPVAKTCPQATGSILLDRVRCTGYERNLLDCPHHRGVGVHDCGHDEDVAVACQRFELSTNDCNATIVPGYVLGKLRVHHNGSWGSVCNRGVGDGESICQSLGYPGGVINNTTGLCITGTGPVHWAGLSCNGTEASPFDCVYNEQTQDCTLDNDLVLLCGPVIRLAQCQTERAGRLEVFADGQWGTVCDDDFDLTDARVACTQLGYSGAMANLIPVAKTCPQATGSILLDLVECTGYERNLLDCLHLGVGVHYCGHDEDVAVACQHFELSTNDCNAEVDPGFVFGRLRVYHNGTWGSVCNRGANNGNTICQSLGFSGGVIKNATGLCSTDTDPIHWAGLSCNGTEASPHDCLHNEQTEDCSHNDVLVLLCGPAVRLAQCQTDRAGRLEVFANSYWGTVCNDQFDSADARVVCDQLGYEDAIPKIIDVAGTCPQATGSILLDDLRCTGNEKSLLDCPHRGIGVHNCRHIEDVAVACQYFELSTSDCNAKVDPRFVLGRLRVYHNGIWGTVCNRGANHGDAICQILGFPGGSIKNPTGLCSNGTGPIHWAGLSCNGTEASPHDCLHNEQTEGCNHNDDLVLLCGPVVRLAQCQTEGAGRLEVFADGQWGTVCDVDFDLTDARVACTQLGYPGVISSNIRVAKTCPKAPDSILLANLRCTGYETSLLDCPHAGLGLHYCRHYRDVAVRCQIPTTPKPPSASSIKRKIGGVVMGSIGVGGVVFMSLAVYKNAKELNQNNEGLSTCQLIRRAVVITITQPCNLCRRRSHSLQPAANEASASTGPSLHRDILPPTYDESNALYVLPTYDETMALYIPPPPYDESNTFPYVPSPPYNESAALDVESIEMATFSTLD